MTTTPLTPSIIYAVGADAGNASMRAAGRSKWSRDDYNAAARASAPLWDLRDEAERRAFQEAA